MRVTSEKVNPGVTFQSSQTPIKEVLGFARPDFRLWVLYYWESNQANFCSCTLQPISDRLELTIGHRRYHFDGVPPQPNCPPAGVPSFESKQREFWRVVFHLRLLHSQKNALNNYYLRYATNLTSQLQATVKFHGVFTSHWNSLAFAPEKSFRWFPIGDSGDLVTPFMQAVNQTARHFATLREL